MKAVSQTTLLKELHAIKRRLAVVERKATALQKVKRPSPATAFRKKYPTLSVDPTLFKLVGSDPPLSLQEERHAIREAVAQKFARK